METTQDSIADRTVALTYTRVSTAGQERDGLSLHVQGAACRGYADARGWAIHQTYQDVVSGNRDDRSQYLAMLADARQIRATGAEAVVIVAALDRFGRRLVERVRRREELKAAGIPLHSVREGGEVSDLVANILAAVAQEETRRDAERVSAVARHLTSEGWRFGAPAPWGYVWRPATDAERTLGSPRSVLDVDPITAPFVRALFERVARGERERGAEEWTATLPAEGRRGTVGRPRSLQGTLRLPVYVARPNSGDPNVLRRPVARWPPLIDDATWQRAQESLTHPRLRYATGRYLLTRFLRCDLCGAAAIGHRVVPYRPHVYSCREAGCRACIGPIAQLDALVLREVGAVLTLLTTGTSHQRAVFRRAWKGLQHREADPIVHERTVELKGEIEHARYRLLTAAALLDSNELDPVGYQAVRHKAQADLAVAEAALADLEARTNRQILPPLDPLPREAREWRSMLQSTDILAQRRVLAHLVDRVQRLPVGRAKYEIEISWTVVGEVVRAAGQKVRDDDAKQ